MSYDYKIFDQAARYWVFRGKLLTREEHLNEAIPVVNTGGCDVTPGPSVLVVSVIDR